MTRGGGGTVRITERFAVCVLYGSKMKLGFGLWGFRKLNGKKGGGWRKFKGGIVTATQGCLPVRRFERPFSNASKIQRIQISF